MKFPNHIIWIALAALFLGACFRDEPPTPEPNGDEIRVQLKFKAKGAGTKAMSVEEEDRIKTVDVLSFYEDNDGVMCFNYIAPVNERTLISPPDSLSQTVWITAKGNVARQQFVVLVNASAEVAAATLFYGEKLTDVMEQIIVRHSDGRGEWPARNYGSEFKYIPMYAKTDTLVVTENTHIIPTNGSTYPLIRMVARIDVTMVPAFPSAHTFELTRAFLFNYQTAGYVGYDFSNYDILNHKVTAPAVPVRPSFTPPSPNTGFPILEPHVGYHATQDSVIRSIYTFEAPSYTPADRIKGIALVVGGIYNGSGVETYYRINLRETGGSPALLSNPILRNHLYKVEIQDILGPGQDNPLDAYLGTSKLVAEVLIWNQLDIDIPFHANYLLEVDRDQIAALAPGGNYKVNVTTDFPTASAPVWTTQVDDAANHSWIGAARSGSVLNITLQPNTTDSTRTGRVKVIADNLTKWIFVAQAPANPLPPSVPAGVTPYVGAFWRANETGERLIRIQNMGASGKWSAIVWYFDGRNLWHPEVGDGIVLAAGGSPNIGGDPEANQLPARSFGYAEGEFSPSNQEILFRIGLQRPFSAFSKNADFTHTFPARYAVVFINYGGNKNMRIYIRQGEDPDYMTPPNPAPDIRFSPYNLGNVNDVQYVAKYPNRFVAYPTQAGWLYQWGYSATLAAPLAYHPINPLTATPSGWSGNLSFNPLYSLAQACPDNYSLPEHSSTSAGLSVLTGAASSWGYYADGFFDRRSLNSASFGHPAGINPAVAVSVNPANQADVQNIDVAYVGRLFYNAAANYASLFFPAAGYRYQDGATNNVGWLDYAGVTGSYWSSTPVTGSLAIPLEFSSGYVAVPTPPSGAVMEAGAAVRCVRYPCLPITGVSVVSSRPAYAGTYMPFVLTATPTPSLPAAEYRWERSTDGINWAILWGETSATLSRSGEPLAGTYYFRVTIRNSCTSQSAVYAQLIIPVT
ncbi:MAG: BACON domain-containing protein [Bacteroidetes bacterium]|nr:BACON domain-containing protein [Bacteroidota bacterium]